MKYIKLYEDFDQVSLVKDILLTLTDVGFKVGVVNINDTLSIDIAKWQTSKGELGIYWKPIHFSFAFVVDSIKMCCEYLKSDYNRISIRINRSIYGDMSYYNYKDIDTILEDNVKDILVNFS